MSLVGGQPEDIVQRWVLDPSEYKKGIKDVATLIREQTKNEKDLDLVRKELTKTSGSFSTALNDQVTQLGKNALATLGVASAVSTLKSAMVGVLSQGLEYEDQLKGNVGALFRMREASAGLSSDLEMQKARARLLNSDLGVTEKQIEAVAKASVEWMRINGEAKPNLDRTVDAVLAGGRGFKQLGIQTEFAGGNFEKSAQALQALENRFSSLEPKLENTNEKVTALKNSFDRIVGSVGSWIIGAKGYQDGLDMMLAGTKNVANGVQFLIEKLDKFNEASLAGMKGMAALYSSIPGFGGVGKTFGAAYVAAGKAQALTGATEGVNQDYFNKLFGNSAAKFLTPDYMSSNLNQPGTKGSGAGDKSSIFGVREWMYEQLAHMEERSARMAEEQADWIAKDTGKGAVMDARTRADRMFEQLEQRRKAGFEWKEREGAVEKLQGTFAGSMMGNKVAEQAMQSADALEKYRASVTGINADMEQFAVGGLASFTAGMWSAADAAIMGGDSFGMAMAKMAKATLLGIATQSTTKAIFELAEGFAATARFAASWGMDAGAGAAATAHFTSAAIYGTVAGVTGAAGLGMSAAMAPSASAGAGSHSNAGSNSYRPSYGSREAADKKPIIVNLWLGGKGDPAAALYMRQQIKAMAA